MNIVLESLLLFLPAGVANMTPVFANKVPGLNQWQTCMDFGKSWRGQRIFGQHKTWRGFVTGVVCGGMAAMAILPLLPDDRGLLTNLLMGLAMGVGALGGDAIKSFFKRRASVKPGGTWFPFDQIDYIVGGLLLLWPFGVLTLAKVAWITALYFCLVLISTYLGYKMRLKDSPI